MEIFDFLKGNKYKKELEINKNETEKLKTELESLKEQTLSIEQKTILELNSLIKDKQKEIAIIENNIKDLHDTQERANSTIKQLNETIKTLEKQVVSIQNDIEMESFGLYVSRYNFDSSSQYKQKLEEIRAQEKRSIKDKTAVNYSTEWIVDGSRSQGRKMTNNNIKQILRSFNTECEAAINKVKFNNIETIEKRINKSYEQLNKLNDAVRVSINSSFLDLKLQELYLAYEYEQKKQEEKEILRTQREKEREEKALQKEIANKKKVIDKEINHFTNMIAELNEKILQENENSIILEQIKELEDKIKQYEDEKKDLDYRTANASAGYVYIISNIGSFGKNIVKIGVTRRLDPLERISELSSASVPFKFDVHALIFSYDAYSLETELHKHFDSKRINKVNTRKEFFNVKIDELEELLKDYKNLTIDFIKTPEAQEYRETLSLIQ